MHDCLKGEGECCCHKGGEENAVVAQNIGQYPAGIF